MAHCTARMLASTTSMPTNMPTSDAPVMAGASSTEPSNTAVTGLSNPSDDTATDGNRAMPRNHNGQPWRAPLPNPADASSSRVQPTPWEPTLIDRAVEAQVAKEHRIVAALKAADLAALDHKLALLLAALESPAEQ